MRLDKYHKTADSGVKQLGKYATAGMYGEGECPGATLAALLHPRSEAGVIMDIQDEHDQPLPDTEHIAERFCRYCTELYSSKMASDDEAISDYLEHIHMTFLTTDQRKCLLAPLHLSEIRYALKSMCVAGAPGSDGLTAAFYKTYQDLLIPHLIMLYEGMVAADVMPPSMREALIITILKPDKQPNKCSSYRPLSLLNVDTKLFDKIPSK